MNFARILLDVQPDHIQLPVKLFLLVHQKFPHRLNSFDGVPLNYDNGDLINVTEKNPTEIVFYSNTINFTEQAAGTSFT